jgi:POTRA domain, FtsQ-type
VVQKYVRKVRAKNSPAKRIIWQRNWRKMQLQWNRIRPLMLIGGTIFIALACIATVLIIFFSPILHIRTISVEKQDTRIDIAELQKQLQPLFDRHLFFVTSTEVERLLLDARHDVESVDIHKQYPDHLIVDVHLKPVVASLRRQGVPAAPTDTQEVQLPRDYITADGLYVFSPLPIISAIDELPIYDIVDIAEWPKNGEFLLRKELLDHAKETEEHLVKQFGYTVTKRTIFVRAQEYHITINDRTLWFDIRTSSKEQLDKYGIFLATKINYPVTEYVDLRLFNKVIWK